MRFTTYPLEGKNIKKTGKPNAGKNVEQMELWYSVAQSVKQYNHFRKISSSFL